MAEEKPTLEQRIAALEVKKKQIAEMHRKIKETEDHMARLRSRLRRLGPRSHRPRGAER